VVWLTEDQDGRRTGPPVPTSERDYAADGFVPPLGVRPIGQRDEIEPFTRLQPHGDGLVRHPQPSDADLKLVVAVTAQHNADDVDDRLRVRLVGMEDVVAVHLNRMQ
jgi:hypothetical protein